MNAAALATAVAGVLIASLVAFMPYARRPRLSVIEDGERIHSRVESTPQGPIPHMRLLVNNSRRRRAAEGTRVLVVAYRQVGVVDSGWTSLAHPSLGWPSAPEAAETAALTVFAGGPRPIGLGRLIRVRVGEAGELMRPTVELNGVPIRGIPHYAADPGDPPAAGWYLWLDLAFNQDLNDNRDKLPPAENGYTIRLLVGANDGAARLFDVDINWDGNPDLTADDVLASALNHLAVRRA